MRTAFIILAAAAAAVLAPIAPTQAESAIVTIGQLEAEGFHVNIDRVGTAPLDRCVVTSVRNPQEETRLIRVDNGHGRDVVVPIVVRRTITVSLDCTK
ncbi:hypothetical protein [Mycolicibacterium aubagnense]|uniref:3-phosphoglycerate kinase n=1 Tax=Mycolicibacterium aubagnense TaxID=319707 RepID=A0ABM7IAW2_9MYCO|nr:hypothetical protein [Mycolicibacterium aubagnense]TLH58335.1 hypothetical protein C1S80_20225 [Mycolicibacterium aubagnense]WGI34338.1 hypothetical protein QDT91_08340 [Mycolicibacterium aubagnense]BBX83818.1 hypothetical protein MAUB_16910 [Mycolicibacterium aubagnense]